MLAALVVFTYFVQRDNSLANALYEDIAANSPFNIAKTTVIATLIWLLAAATIAGDAAARDVSTRMYPLIYTGPASRAGYVGGRFVAALAINALLLLGVQAAIMAAVYSPGVDAMRIGPFRLAAYLTAYAYIALPTAFVATALQFALALRSGRPMASYFGSVLLLFMSFFVASLLLYGRGLGTLLDPIGMRLIIEDIAHRWTTVEQNTRLLTLDGIVLRNRLVWIGIGAGTFAITLFGFRFAHRAESGPWWRRSARRRDAYAPTPAGLEAAARAPVVVPEAIRSFGVVTRLRGMLAVAWDSFRAIAKSWAGFFMLGFIPLITVLVVLDQMTALGTPLVPVTGQVIKVLTAPLSAELSRWVIVPLLSIYFAGELVWRERDTGLSEIGDAAPVPEWVPLIGKFLGLALILATFMVLLALSGMVAQTILGYHRFEIGLYGGILLGLQLPEYLVFAALAFVIHVVVTQKYIGHLVAVVAYGVIVLAPMFGIEHNLLIYDGGPWWSYTEMRGLAPFIWPWLWFKLYWAAWALLLGVVARLLWVRGREGGVGGRLHLARERFTSRAVGVAAFAAGLVLALGGFILYNTNVLNEHLSASALEERSAEYEQRYGRYADLAQPGLASAELRIDIHPERGAVDIDGAYRLVNRTGVTIDSIHLDLPRGADSISFDRPATPVLTDEKLHHSIYALEHPLQPGDSARLRFQMHVAPRGFRDRGADVSITRNATLFTNVWLPAIGYQRSRELLSPSDRRKHGLRERPVIPSLYDAAARKGVNAGIDLDVVMSTSDDQVAVAPGELRKSWTDGGRRYFHYSTNAPIGSEWSFASARYEARDLRWKDVAIRLLHYPGHTRHLDRMIEGIEAALDYYTAQLGRYPYGQLTVLEVPGDGVGIHADASMLTHGEGITYLQPRPGHLDLPYAVAGHEMGHEWNIPAAFVEGAPIMSESVAWYEAIKLVEHTKGEVERRRLLAFMRQPYPYAPIRRGEPLLRALDPYMSYRKGPFALYLLSQYVGEEQVNGALRRLWRAHTREGAPLATTLDLYRELQAATPDSLRPLLLDLFEVNTYWTFATEQPTAEQNADGTWRVMLHLRARKSVVDSAGVETIVPLSDRVEIGVFGEGEKGDELANPLYLEKRQISSGSSTITLTVSRKPVLAGIDPFHLLDWEEGEDDDNVEMVRIEQAGDPVRE
jgi:ABC-type transport system involved in multi-copper enzyme maturation permease subunit